MSKVIPFCLMLFAGSYLPAQDYTLVKLEELQERYTRKNDTTYIVNFFATWCGPCILEIPVLNDFRQKHLNTKTQLLMVSLDNARTLKKLPGMIKKMKIEAPVYVMNESADYSWLPYVDKRWQGSIPATLVVNNAKNIKALFETPLEEGQLDFYLMRLGLK